MTEIDVDIRKADERDLKDILKLLEKNHVYTDDVKDILDNFLLATYEGKIVGCISHYILEEDVFVIRSLTVAEKFRNKGIAKKLSKLKIQYAKKNGFKHVYARTSMDNKEARGLSKSLKFRELTGKELYESYPLCRVCRGEYDKMNPYCKEHSIDKKCSVVTYLLDI